MHAKLRKLKSVIFDTAHLSGMPRLLAPAFGGVGAIIAMHRVCEPRQEAFQPNRTLEVTPEFLDSTLTQVRDLGLDIVSLDEVARRLRERDFKTRFVCFTLDDGYADNYEKAAPVFKEHDAPFAIYATTGFLDGTAFFWWMLLEKVIRDHDEVTLRFQDRAERRSSRTLEEKASAFEAWHERFRDLATGELEVACRYLCEDYGIDLDMFCAQEAMTWEMARDITAGGLGTIEAHTERHVALSKQEPAEIRADMARVAARIAEMTGRTPGHFAFPFGDERAVSRNEIEALAGTGIVTATTTRAGMLRPHHADDLMALPRIVLNGFYQSAGFIELTLSGLPYALSRG